MAVSISLSASAKFPVSICALIRETHSRANDTVFLSEPMMYFTLPPSLCRHAAGCPSVCITRARLMHILSH